MTLQDKLDALKKDFHRQAVTFLQTGGVLQGNNFKALPQRLGENITPLHDVLCELEGMPLFQDLQAFPLALVLPTLCGLHPILIVQKRANGTKGLIGKNVTATLASPNVQFHRPAVFRIPNDLPSTYRATDVSTFGSKPLMPMVP